MRKATWDTKNKVVGEWRQHHSDVKDSLFLPFKRQQVKHPELNKGVSAQRTRVLGHSTYLYIKNGETRTHRGGRTRNTVEREPAIPAHQPQQLSAEPREPRIEEEEMQTTVASPPPCNHSQRKMGSSEGQGSCFCPLSQRHPGRPLPAAAEPMNLTKPDMAEVPAPASSLPPSPSPVL